MKTLLAWMLLVTAGLTVANVSRQTRQSYRIRNPQGWACAPEYDSRHYFTVLATVHLDQMTIDEASYEGTIERP